jgi:hypothetical protein
MQSSHYVAEVNRFRPGVMRPWVARVPVRAGPRRDRYGKELRGVFEQEIPVTRQRYGATRRMREPGVLSSKLLEEGTHELCRVPLASAVPPPLVRRRWEPKLHCIAKCVK